MPQGDFLQMFDGLPVSVKRRIRQSGTFVVRRILDNFPRLDRLSDLTHAYAAQDGLIGGVQRKIDGVRGELGPNPVDGCGRVVIIAPVSERQSRCLPVLASAFRSPRHDCQLLDFLEMCVACSQRQIVLKCYRGNPNVILRYWMPL